MRFAGTCHRLIAPLCLAAAFAASVQSAAAQSNKDCTGISFISAGDAILTYDPFNPKRETVDFELIFANPQNTQCFMGLAVRSESGGSNRLLTGPGSPLPYDLRLNGHVLRNDLLTAIGNVPLHSGNLGEVRVRVRVEVPEGLAARAGTYADLLTVRAYDVKGPAQAQIGTDQVVQLRLAVPAKARITLAGGYGSGSVFGRNSLDLGEMRNGSSASAAVRVQSTSAVRLEIASENRGDLKLAAHYGPSASIPYLLSFDGEALDLRQGSVAVRRDGIGPLRGVDYKMTASVPPQPNKPAGTYNDLIVITVEAD